MSHPRRRRSLFMAVMRLSFLPLRLRLRVIAILLVGLLLHVPSTMAFQFKKDTGDDCSTIQIEDCQQRRQQRQQSSPLWFSCPVTCAELLHREGSMAEVHDTPEAFFQIHVRPFHHQHPPPLHSPLWLSLEDYEGYVTVVAVVPTAYPDMAQFHYQLLEHVASVYPFTVQILLVPLDNDNDNDDSTSSSSSSSSSSSATPPATPKWEPPRRNKATKVVILEPITATDTTTTSTGTTTTTTTSPPSTLRLLEYVAHAKVVAGHPLSSSSSSLVADDCVTVFLVSFDGMFIERLIAPTLMELERRIGVHLLQLEFQAEL